MAFRAMFRNIGAKINQIPPASSVNETVSGTTAAVGKSTAKKVVKVPKAPKVAGDHGPKIRFPKTALHYYSMKHWAAVKRNNPTKADSWVRATLAAQWTALSPETRRPYETEADSDATRYAEETRDLPADKRSELETARSKLDAQIIEAEKLREKYQMPKHPQTPFAEYISENYETKSDAETYKEFCGRMADQWAKHPTDDKEARKKKYADEKAEYDGKLTAWKEKMIANGKEDEVHIMTRKPRYQY